MRRLRGFLDPLPASLRIEALFRPYGKLGDNRLKMEEFSSQVGGGDLQNLVGGGALCNFHFCPALIFLEMRRFCQSARVSRRIYALIGA